MGTTAQDDDDAQEIEERLERMKTGTLHMKGLSLEEVCTWHFNFFISFYSRAITLLILFTQIAKKLIAESIAYERDYDAMLYMREHIEEQGKYIEELEERIGGLKEHEMDRKKIIAAQRNEIDELMKMRNEDSSVCIVST